MPQYLARAVKDGLFYLEPDESRHLVKVARARLGDEVQVFDGRGRRWRCRLDAFDEGRARGAVIEELPEDRPGRDILLNLALINRPKLEDALEKCTELGLAAFRPIVTERTEVKLRRGKAAAKLGRWRDIVLAACKQSGRARLPKVFAPVKFETAVREGAGLLAVPGGRRASMEQALRILPEGPARVFVGPEGGFTDNEVESAKAAGCVLTSLGPTVLRAETAAVAAVARILIG